MLSQGLLLVQSVLTKLRKDRLSRGILVGEDDDKPEPVHHGQMTPENAPLQLVELRGGPAEQGRMHGEALRDQIRENVEIYRRRLCNELNLTFEQIESRSAAFAKIFGEVSPEYRKGIDAVAAASNCSVTAISMLNARYELMYSAYSDMGIAEARGGCTSIAVSRALTTDGHLWIGQTWDWIPDVRCAILDVYEDDLRILAFTEAGIVGGKIGMNSRGVGLLINGLLTNLDDWAQPGVPFHVRTWGILRSRTLSEALGSATKGAHPCSANFLIAQSRPTEAVVAIEVSPKGFSRIIPEHGILVHTNHFLSPSPEGVWEPLGDEKVSSANRLRQAKDLLSTWIAKGHISPENLRQLLRDHLGYPDSICSHPDPTISPNEQMQTMFAILMDLDALQMSFASELPCTAEFRLLSFA